MVPGSADPGRRAPTSPAVRDDTAGAVSEWPAGAGEQLRAAQMDFARPPILARPFQAGVVLLARRMAGKIGVFQIAARERSHVGASCTNDRVDVAVADDPAHRHGCDVEFVADLIAVCGLEGSAVGGTLYVDDA